ncbi:calcium-binding protein [Mariniblastus fucicola]|uniref:Leukotoxin n=1 Tax=Mariniblastus fucicola TaxID=980251 RepID=A0A5B9PAA7_9BACT|nr:calcium-binding protein [Mariniblastus fucicola]QEG23308.1 Leukotoxin [Mariniblastus fucicola]
MNDDFAADATTIGTYTVSGTPLSAQFEVANDEDWIRVKGMRQFFAYDIWLFRSKDENYIQYASSLSVFDQESKQLWEYPYSVRVPDRTEYLHFGETEDHFVSISSPSTVGGYRLFIRSGDYASNVFEAATYFAPFRTNQFASALENNEDVDFLKYRLFEGVDYTFNLYGRRSNEKLGTTLGRMVLRLFDPEGSLLAEDDQTATNRNASITFTPDETADYVFEVDSDAATGSYILESEQFDDILGNVNTTAVLLSDGTPSSGQGNHGAYFSRYDADQDWFRIQTRAGFNYEVESDFASLTLRNRSGELIDVEYIEQGSFDNSRRKFRFRSQGDGTFFIAAGRLQGGGGEYAVTANVIDDHIANLRYATNFNFNSSTVGTINGAIETVGDRDWIRIPLRNFANYRFTIDAHPALRMAVSVRDEDGNILKEGVPFQSLVFSQNIGQFNDSFYLDLRSNAGATGNYTLRSEALTGGSDSSTMWNVDMTTGAGRIRGLASNGENAAEIWHRFEVTPNTWYEIESNQVNFEIVIGNGSGSVASYNAGKRYYYSGSSTASIRYLVVDPKDHNFQEQGFEINITKDARLRLENDREFSPQDTRFATNTFGFRAVEVYSSVPFTYQHNGETFQVEANSYQTLDTNQWFSIEFNDTFDGVGEFYFREVRTEGNSQWSSTELYGHHLPEGISRTNIIVPHVDQLTYAFAEGRPDYLQIDDAVVGETQALTVAEREVVVDAIFQWDRFIPFDLVESDPGVDNDAAPIMIYKAEIDSDVLAFSLNGDPLGNGLAGDIILNVNSPLWDDLSDGTQGPFEILRSVGISLGADYIANAQRDQSVMGAELTGDRADLPYPTGLLPIDINGLRQQGKTYVHPPTSVNQYRLDGDESFYETIVHYGKFDGSNITAYLSPHDATIDLRPGQSSFITTEDGSQPATWVMSNFSVIVSGRGGSGDDSLRGNELDNTLYGSSGNDTIIGGVGDDYVSGGRGDDYYSYRLGHGNDMVDEALDGNGTDTLRIEGLKNFDGIEDLRFRRFGDNLKITLELDGNDKNADAIVIKNMAIGNSRVEKLVLIQEGNFLHSLSLPSVWAQTDQQLRRFELQEGSDSFGRLVAPV